MNNLDDDKNNMEQLAKIRDAYTSLVDYLRELMFKKRILNSPSYAELSRKLGFRYNWIKEKKYSMKQGHFPKKETFDDLYNRLSERYMDQLSKSWKEIQTRFNALYTFSFSTDMQSLSDLNSNQKSIKREFFNNIKEIIKLYFPNARIFDTDISRLFFIRARALKDSHLKGDFKFRMLELSTLFSFIFKIRILPKEQFINKIRDIDSAKSEKLQQIKKDIEVFIEEFIFANPFDVKYISDKHDTGTRFFKPEYDLTLNVWHELSLTEKSPILLKHVKKILKYDSFGRLNRGYRYSYDGLMNMLKELIVLLPSEAYNRAFEYVSDYIKIRKLYPTQPRNYHSSWYTASTVKFHIIMLIIRDLGLDILNLEPIEPKAFKKTKQMESYTYERHHVFIYDKFSIDVNRLALVMHTNHYDLEGKSDLVLDLIKQRIDLTLKCPQYYKDNLRDWREKWQIYLKRRNFLIQNGIVNFIREYFTDDDGNNYIFERFFNNVPKDNIEQEIRNFIHEWKNKNRPTPILNIHIIKRLFCGTPNLVTSGFIQYKS